MRRLSRHNENLAMMSSLRGLFHPARVQNSARKRKIKVMAARSASPDLLETTADAQKSPDDRRSCVFAFFCPKCLPKYRNIFMESVMAELVWGDRSAAEAAFIAGVEERDIHRLVDEKFLPEAAAWQDESGPQI